MAEEETVFSSKIKYTGVFQFQAFYEFCYNWLREETGLDISERKYSEKLTGDSKSVEVEWEGLRKLTDYFRFRAKIKMTIHNMVKVEINQGGVKVNANKGQIEVKVEGILQRDYQGKFEMTAFQKFLRGIYEKWVIKSMTDNFEGIVAGDCDEFLAQGKAYLDLEGRR